MTIPGDKWVLLRTGEAREVEDVVGKTVKLLCPDGQIRFVLLRDLRMTHAKVPNDS